MITLHIPYPPSVNHYWGISGKQRFLGKKGKEFRQAVAEACLDLEVKTMEGNVSVFVALWPPDKRTRDIDNTIKPLLDAMEHAGVYENDCQINQLHVVRKDPIKGGACAVVITANTLPSGIAQYLPKCPASDLGTPESLDA
jgi:crossover junction endodeoxyribonuclease RusA